jgi:4-hydroxyphenylpyruvate dioxygenase
VRRLRDNGVLYDRDEGGEFLHVYTQTVDGRFYVELLQRVDSYDGYGAPNTHVRLAAQAVARRRTPDRTRLGRELAATDA